MLAACVAEAMRPAATVESVVAVALELAKDGTRTAIEAVAIRGGALDGWRDDGLAVLRDAFAPYDSVGEHYASPAQNARIPSRLHAIEELPIALGLLAATGGDCAETVLGGVNYGRDSDSIASMGGALAGALGGATRSRASGSRRSPRRAASTSRRPAGRWRRSPSRSSRRTSAATSGAHARSRG